MKEKKYKTKIKAMTLKRNQSRIISCNIFKFVIKDNQQFQVSHVPAKILMSQAGLLVNSLPSVTGSYFRHLLLWSTSVCSRW